MEQTLLNDFLRENHRDTSCRRSMLNITGKVTAGADCVPRSAAGGGCLMSQGWIGPKKAHCQEGMVVVRKLVLSFSMLSNL